jgi:hypothetical protein
MPNGYVYAEINVFDALRYEQLRYRAVEKFHRSRQLATLLVGGADGGGLRVGDGELAAEDVLVALLGGKRNAVSHMLLHLGTRFGILSRIASQGCAEISRGSFNPPVGVPLPE